MADIILGIDPGSRFTGYAVLTKQQNKFKTLRCDVISLAHLENHSDRLQTIFDKISSIIASVQPSQCAIETPVYGVDPLAMLKLGRAQAAAMLAITNSGISVTEYYPKEVKKSITGNGNAGKQQVAFMLKKVVDLPAEKLKDDATDALAVAWCHYTKQKNIPTSSKEKHQNNRSDSWSEFIKNNPDRVRD
ncbi:MAG TPA: crossover junction endodeoxyribonuclease RuvC [Balneolaceae bacterium]|nr:crossover junction endodeoxyribonuclease RuvC [Balneolaceae bacterium]